MSKANQTLQKGINKWSEKLNYELRIKVDGTVGPQTLRAAKIVGYSLGVGPNNRLALKRGRLTRDLRALLRRDRKRTKKELKRAGRRKAWRRATRAKLKGGPNKAVQYLMQYKGKTESPPGSNKAPWGLTNWQLSFGAWLIGQPWCGIAVGKALQAAGVKGITSRVAGVALIEEDAKAGRNGFKSWHGPTEGKRGDAVVLFGYGVHVGLIRKRIPGVGYLTVEGNTSSGITGSQDNGGGVWPRLRTYSSVRGCARPAY